MKNSLETRLGVFAALAVIAAVILLELAGSADLFNRSYRAHCLFKNVQDLKTGDPVKMAGVPVGRVEKLALTNNLVQVTMLLDRNIIVRTDSKARIKFVGLMGANFVSVDFGTEKGVKLDPDKFIETVEQADLSEMVARLDNVAAGIEGVTKSFSGDKIDNLLGPFTDFLKQNREPLSQSFNNLRIISDQIAQGKGTVGRLIREDGLYTSMANTFTNFEATSADVRVAMQEGREIMANARAITTNMNLTLTKANAMIDGVNEGRGTIGMLITDKRLYNETADAMTSLREIMQKMNRGEGSVGRLINDESLFKNAKLTLQKLDKTTEGLEDQGPLSILGMAVGTLF